MVEYTCKKCQITVDDLELEGYTPEHLRMAVRLCPECHRKMSFLPERTFTQSAVLVLKAIGFAVLLFGIPMLKFREVRAVVSTLLVAGAGLLSLYLGLQIYGSLGKDYRDNWASAAASIIIASSLMIILMFALNSFRLYYLSSD